jgi:hypothetical protein
MTTSLGYSDSISKSIVWRAYANYFAGEEIMEEGFNPNSGYVYIALENGITIASCFAQEVDFIVWDNDTDEEIIFDSCEELEIYLNK